MQRWQFQERLHDQNEDIEIQRRDCRDDVGAPPATHKLPAVEPDHGNDHDDGGNQTGEKRRGRPGEKSETGETGGQRGPQEQSGELRLLLAGNTGVLAVSDGQVVDIVTRIDLIQYWDRTREKK